MGVSTATTQLVAPPHLTNLEARYAFFPEGNSVYQLIDQNQTCFSCRFQVNEAKRLMATDPTVGLELIQKTLFHVKKLECTELVVELYGMLQVYYSSVKRNELLAYKYRALMKRSQAQQQAEQQVAQYYDDLLHQSGALCPEAFDWMAKLEEYYTESSLLLRQYPSYHIRLFTTLIGLMLHTQRQDFQATLLLCQISRVAFEKKHFLAKIPLQIVYYYSLICTVQMRMYEDGHKTAKKGLALCIQNSFNWFKFKELQVLLCTNTAQYQEAYQHIVQSMRAPGFEKLPAYQQETWLILKAYLLFIKYLRSDKCLRPKSILALKRLVKSAERIAKASKQKPFVLHLVNIIFTFATHQREQMVCHMNQLQDQKGYEIRLGNSVLMIVKIFGILIDNDFQVNLLKEKEKCYLQYLRATLSSRGNLDDLLQIIPVENLWVNLLLNLRAW